MGVSIKKTRQSFRKKNSENKATVNPVYREIITPAKKKVSITLPETLVGKTVEVFAFEVSQSNEPRTLSRQPFTIKDFWETFGSGKHSAISADRIRENAWRKNRW